jgi:hypothetical protein
MNNSFFQLLIYQKKFAEANRIYVLEIIYRLHAASLITFRRNLAWIESIEIARNNCSYFTFCSSLRSLIESAADSFYSLKYVPQNLATYHNIFKKCIEKKENVKVHSFKELEDWGIHFLEAGNYENKDFPQEHYKAKATWEYIKSIDVDSKLKPVYSLYKELCQILHPSRETAYLYFKERDNGYWNVKNINEKEQIEKIENLYDTEYEEIFQKSFNTALIIIWLIDKLPIEELKCPLIRKINFTEIREFWKIQKMIS